MFLLTMGFHKLHIPHYFMWVPVSDNAAFIYQNHAIADLENDLKVMRGD